jgi:hypothetical protein
MTADELATAILPTLQALSDQCKMAIAANEAISLIAGVLIAEIAKLDSDPRPTLDRILTLATGVIEAFPDSDGHVLAVVDIIRSAAEACCREAD